MTSIEPIRSMFCLAPRKPIIWLEELQPLQVSLMLIVQTVVSAAAAHAIIVEVLQP